MRRYKSLGLMRSRHARRRNELNRTPAERFVSESQVKDVILYNRLARTRPGIQTLEFANDDVDWQLEYFCELLGKWLKRVIGWIVWLFQFLINCIQRRMRRKRRRSGGGGEGDDKGDEFEDGFKFPRNLVTRTGSIVKLPVSMDKDANSKVWRFKQCQPLSNRRFLRRKWLLKPETREWAEEALDTFQRHVSRGFRSLCSAVGKDTKIYVVSAAAPSNESTSGTQIRTTVFLADSSVLKSQSILFRTWFLQSGDRKEIETSFVTPEEMEAILVYIYTLTWPINVTTPVGGRGDRRRRLSDRFFEILIIYGISLKLIKEDPFHDGVYEEPCYDSLVHPIFSQSNLPSSCGSGDGQGDFIQFFNETPVKGESKISAGSSSTPFSQVEDVRNLRSFLRDKLRLPNVSRRVHPEPVLPTDERLRLINTLQTNDFVIITHRRPNNNNNSSVEELESV